MELPYVTTTGSRIDPTPGVPDPGNRLAPIRKRRERGMLKRVRRWRRLPRRTNWRSWR